MSYGAIAMPPASRALSRKAAVIGVGESDFGARIQGSPAISGNALFVRSDKHLWKITNAK